MLFFLKNLGKFINLNLPLALSTLWKTAGTWLERLQTGTVAPGHHDNNRCWQTNRCHISLSRRPLCTCALACGCAGERERAGVYLSARERTGVGLVFFLSLLSCTHASVAISGDGWWTPSVHLHKLATYCNLVPAFSLSSPLSDSKSKGGDILFLSVLPDLTIFIFLYFHLLHLSFHHFYSCHIGLLQTSLSRSLSHCVLFFSSLSLSLFLSVANLLLAPGLLPVFTIYGLCVCLCCLCMCWCVRSAWQRSRCRTLSAATLFHQHQAFRANYIMLWLCVRVCDTKRSPAHPFIVPVLYCVCKDSHTSASSYSCLYSLSNHIVYTAVFKTVFMKLFDR